MALFKLNPPPANILPGSQIIAYLRDSGHETQELSTIQQQNALSAWAVEHGLIIVRFYIDEARKGSTIGRDQLQVLMHDLRHSAPVKAVVVWSYNRFSRGLDDPVLYRAEVRTLGYAFHSLTDDVPEGPIGRIVEAVIDYKNYQYLVDLSIDIRRGQRDLVERYGCIPGTPPVGFKRTPVTIGQRRDGQAHTAHRWEPDPETAPHVLKAFKMRAAGASLIEIIAATGIYTGVSSFATFWGNRIYIGTLQFSDLTIEKYCEPIIPLDLWETVQERQAGYKRSQHVNSDQNHPRRTSSRYLLSGLLRCAQCGAVVNGNTSSYRGKRATDTYGCSNLRKHTCTARRIPREQLEKVIIDSIKDFVIDPDIAAARQELDERNHAADHKKGDQERKELNRRLGKVRKELRNIDASIRSYGHSKTLFASLKELEKQETSLLTQLAENKGASLPPMQLTHEQLLTQAAIISKLLDNGSLEEKRATLRGIIHSIKVENDEKHIRGIVFYYSPIQTDRIPEPDHPPPDAVRLVRVPPGAPRFIHSIEFDKEYKKTRSRK